MGLLMVLCQDRDGSELEAKRQLSGTQIEVLREARTGPIQCECLYAYTCCHILMHRFVEQSAWQNLCVSLTWFVTWFVRNNVDLTGAQQVNLQGVRMKQFRRVTGHGGRCLVVFHGFPRVMCLITSVATQLSLGTRRKRSCRHAHCTCLHACIFITLTSLGLVSNRVNTLGTTCRLRLGL